MPEFKAGTPQPLFQGLQNIGRNNYEVTPEGQRFLMLGSLTQTSGPAPIVVVLSWNSGAKQ